MKFSIVIPVYNESKNIPLLINQIYKVLKSQTFELILVDDNSTDETKNIMKNYQKKNLKYLIRKQERDLTKSCVFGFEKSKYKNILVMDGDLQHRPIDIIKLIITYKKKKADFVIGTRNLFKKKKHNLSFFRLSASRILILLVNYFLGKKTSDPMSGFFIFKKKNFNKSKLYPYGFKILLSLIYSSNQNININEFQIKFNKRQNNRSKMNLKVLYHIVCSIIYHLFK